MKPRLNPPTFFEKFEIVVGIRYFWHGVVITSAIWLGLIISGLILVLYRRRRSP